MSATRECHNQITSTSLALVAKSPGDPQDPLGSLGILLALLPATIPVGANPLLLSGLHFRSWTMKGGGPEDPCNLSRSSLQRPCILCLSALPREASSMLESCQG